MAKRFAGVTPLDAEDIARAILYAIGQPAQREHQRGARAPQRAGGLSGPPPRRPAQPAAGGVAARARSREASGPPGCHTGLADARTSPPDPRARRGRSRARLQAGGRPAAELRCGYVAHEHDQGLPVHVALVRGLRAMLRRGLPQLRGHRLLGGAGATARAQARGPLRLAGPGAADDRTRGGRAARARPATQHGSGASPDG